MDSSPTALFESYEQDFQQIAASIRDKLEGSGQDERGGKRYLVRLSGWVLTTPVEQRKAVLRRVELELDEADEMVGSQHALCVVDG